MNAPLNQPTQSEPATDQRREESAFERGRGLPSVNRNSSLQQRASRLLAMALMGAVGIGMMTWYYSRAFSKASANRPVHAVNHAVEGEMVLPALGPVAMPKPPAAPSADASTANPAPNYVIGNILGEPPALGTLANESSLPSTGGASVGPPPVPPPVDRRFTGPVFQPGGSGAGSLIPAAQSQALEAALVAAHADSRDAPTGPSLSAQFKTPVTAAVQAGRLPTQRLLLPRGSFIDCTLETAVDSSLPGLVTCLTATDTFSADGTVVLLERGSKLVGETRGEVKAGAARVFIIWTEARTPTGVVAELDSPATDALGRAGVGGTVDRHFWERFGSAILLSVVDGAVQAETNRSSSGTTVVTSGQASSEILGEVLKDTINIPPTVTIDAGTRVQAVVARDVDFRSVYALELAPGA